MPEIQVVRVIHLIGTPEGEPPATAVYLSVTDGSPEVFLSATDGSPEDPLQVSD